VNMLKITCQASGIFWGWSVFVSFPVTIARVFRCRYESILGENLWSLWT
jgi:hypothetical protein